MLKEKKKKEQEKTESRDFVKLAGREGTSRWIRLKQKEENYQVGQCPEVLGSSGGRQPC